METRILRVQAPKDSLGTFTSGLEKWTPTSPSDPALSEAAHHLRSTDIPVAFPTETVYGLGADATRSAAVKGIYTAKGRPSDNPLIVHVCDLTMLRGLLRSKDSNEDADPIPEIYQPLIKRFWPGPLTILLPLPNPSPLAPEVSAGLPTFGARMPSSALARSLIALAKAPLAAPSANASTRPSPTSAQHVADDLNGRIEVILDDGEICGVGVESTVVDGLCDPPVVLRPGGIGIEELRRVPGWEKVEKAYKDGAENGASAPRAPGMKYKHYSPRAKVVLYEARARKEGEEFRHEEFESVVDGEEREKTVAFIRTGGWPLFGGLACVESVKQGTVPGKVREGKASAGEAEFKRVLDIDLGRDVKGVAQGLFSALRELDREGADVIYVEGVDDGDDIAAAVMNRLRKAASVIKS